MRRLAQILLMVVVSIVVAVGCSEHDSEIQSSAVAPDLTATTANSVTVIEGELGTGAMYALFCPAEWNGDLVLYAHGYVFTFASVQLPNIDDLRDAWLDMGYGVAYSSYSENGFAVKEGRNNTKQLRGLFAANFGMPANTYVTGHSMGGLISLLLVERNPNLFAGALPLCGVVGSGQMAVDYVMGVRVLFDYFYPDVLPGDAQFVPPELDPATAVNLALAAILADPMPAFELAGVDPINIQYANVNELIDAILTNIFFHVGGWADFFDRTHQHEFFDNMDVVYTGSSDDVALNAGVDRFEATPDALQYFKQWYEPRGNLKIPVVTLHTSRDQLVQVFQQDRYAETVAAAGKSHLLVQHVIDRYGHCAFTLEEQLAVFAEMVELANNPPQVTRGN
jgi:pimeloyl-ACP methyl ester carboxylesterase